MDPDEWDRLMGITSVDISFEENGFGDGELTDTENPIEGVANDSATPLDSHSGSGIHPGAHQDSRGYGSANFAEVLNSLPNLAAPAACASQGAAEFLAVQGPPATSCVFNM